MEILQWAKPLVCESGSHLAGLFIATASQRQNDNQLCVDITSVQGLSMKLISLKRHYPWAQVIWASPDRYSVNKIPDSLLLAHTGKNACRVGGVEGKQAGEPPESRWLPSRMDARKLRGVTGVQFASWKGIGHLMEGYQID
ncbi:hypothetical protein EVAR_96449_1 [Eumeta japonica]|uniref:Uncharacterized protein n=1 Tax=Eumeta variegata TaxID=151549 RepID=A0A4C1VX70_EUMVA|nr:hypothetical protein EVAR_96449_1 [Eumeta japonica]